MNSPLARFVSVTVILLAGSTSAGQDNATAEIKAELATLQRSLHELRSKPAADLADAAIFAGLLILRL